MRESKGARERARAREVTKARETVKAREIRRTEGERGREPNLESTEVRGIKTAQDFLV